MKNSIKSFKNIAIAFITILSINIGAKAQEGSQKYKEVLSLLESKGYSISVEQYALLEEGEEAGHTKTFYAGTSYVIVACSDDSDVNDVDVFLNNTSGTTYDQDADSADVAVVEFNPSFTREMRVNIKNYSSETPYYASRCRFVIAYK